MTAFIHAPLLVQYAQDALETETPWQRWQWYDVVAECWVDATASLIFYATLKYRRKPQTVTRTITYPEPLKELPEGCEEIWIPKVNVCARPEAIRISTHSNFSPSDGLIKAGLAHTTIGAALSHAKAWLGEGDENEHE